MHPLLLVAIIVIAMLVAAVIGILICLNTMKAVQKMQDEQDNILHPPPGSESEFHG